MIRTDKVRLMARSAIFEKEEGRKALDVNRYFHLDYIGYGLVKSAVSWTLAFLLMAAIPVLYNSEYLMTEMNIDGLAVLGRQILIAYVASLVGFLAISAVVYSVRHHRAQKKLKGYRSNLRRLLKLYDEEGTE